MVSATILPCLLAGPASGTMVLVPITKSSVSTISPTAYILGSEVLIYSSTITPPLAFNLSPASFASSLFALIPIESITISAFTSLPSSSTIFEPDGLWVILLTPFSSTSKMPFSAIWR